jgi:uncharacterized protein (TIGR02246 family)
MNLFKKPVLQIMVALVFGAVATGVSAADAAPTADVAALQSVEQSWFEAYEAGDADAVTALYADDATLMPPGSPGAVHKDAIRNFFISGIAESKRAGYVMSMVGTPAGGVAGDWGWLSGAYTVTDKTGHAVSSGKFLSIYRKVDGKWLFLRDTWNSDK